MSNKIQIRRGNLINLPTLDEGEFGFARDAERLYIGNPDGSGNILMSIGPAGFDLGNGADGYVTFFTGQNAIAGDNDFFWDRASNRLGLRTDEPTHTLTVDGYITPATDNMHALGTPDQRWEALWLGPSSLHIHSHPSETGTSFDWRIGIDQTTGNEGKLVFAQGDSLLMSLDPVSNTVSMLVDEFQVGGSLKLSEISSPPIDEIGFGKLYVDSGDTAIHFLDSTGTDYNLLITGGSGTGNVDYSQGADGYLAFFIAPGHIAGDNDLFFDRESHDLTLMGGGRIGIGTTVPTELLTVAGNVSIGGNIINPTLTETFETIRTALDGYTGADPGLSQTVQEHYNQHSEALQTIMKDLDGYGTGSGDVTKVGTPADNQIGVWTGDGTLEAAGNLTWDGSLMSIGTSSPNAMLTVHPGAVGTTTLGGINFNLGALVRPSSNRSAYMAQTANDYLLSATPNGHFVSIFPFADSSNSNDRTWKSFKAMTGTTLSDVFWVNKYGEGFFSGAITVGTDPTTNAPLNMLNIEGSAAIGATYAGPSPGTAAPTNGMIVQGDVGIGTASPLFKLDVNGDMQVAGAIINADLSETFQVIRQALDGYGSGSGDVTKVGTPVDNEIGVWTGDGTLEGDTNFTWDGTKLGVGTDSPIYKFHLLEEAGPGNTATARFDTYGDAEGARLFLNHANGTISSASALTSGQTLGQIGFGGYDGTAIRQNAARITATTQDNWSGTNWGSTMHFYTTDVDTTTNTVRMRIRPSGDIEMYKDLSIGGDIINNSLTEAFQNIATALDGYSDGGGGGGLSEITFQENKTFWNEAIHHLTTAADGYAQTVPTSIGDGYLAFYDGNNNLAGDNNLSWDRESGGLIIRTRADSRPLISTLVGTYTSNCYSVMNVTVESDIGYTPAAGYGGRIAFVADTNTGVATPSAAIGAVWEDATNGAVDSALTFYTRENNSSFIENMRLTAVGNLGIGRTPTTNTLEVNGDASKTTAATWLANSDRKIKTDIRTILNGLEIIKKLNPVIFKYTDEHRNTNPSIKEHDYYNYIAQEYQEVFPNSVQNSGEDDILQIETGAVTPHLVSAVQELSKVIETQNQIIATLQMRLDDQEARIAALESP